MVATALAAKYAAKHIIHRTIEAVTGRSKVEMSASLLSLEPSATFVSLQAEAELSERQRQPEREKVEQSRRQTKERERERTRRQRLLEQAIQHAEFEREWRGQPERDTWGEREAGA